MEIVDALKRLERAGSENSKATQKLHEAARRVAAVIENAVPVGIKLPRGYKVCRIKSNVGEEIFLTAQPYTLYINGIGRYLHGDFNAWIPAQTRYGSLKFAKDIAEGLLDEIAKFLEDRATESATMADCLNAAADNQRG